ncbi:MAG: UbiD family decarboxylase, partial [Rhodospirillaceae bacterium]|nr:UbiD family decarboxylase [Rhodospirillaceae bacterium]
WPSGPIYEAAVRRALHEAGVQTTAVNITPGGCCHWHAIIAVKPLPGDAKNAMMAALSVADMKHVVVVDEEIDVFDGVDVEWAIATRVQADKDVMIVSGARSKPLDPSLVIVPGHIPTTSKMGIDATISDDIPRERYERIAYAYADQINLEDVLGEGGTKEGAEDISPDIVSDLAERIRTVIEKEPLYYAILAERFSNEGFQAVGRALGLLHERGELWQDHLGQFCLVGSEFAAVPPSGRG